MMGIEGFQLGPVLSHSIPGEAQAMTSGELARGGLTETLYAL